ncbi:hypothetical protein SISNIDRAFT_471597 [Sistotremastrum niveocremeum HHB9708]|uniref:Uncharacterized protein n=1 Tax=Sistotremastrum niveocremeum HHB9708 TaxID=1314777 RepID=A0A164MFP3_9AGAM|nr:hypothetical protein SISNIDRAFT_471597 [Sistotremastrum niveocremeum HHB9708]
MSDGPRVTESIEHQRLHRYGIPDVKKPVVEQLHCSQFIRTGLDSALRLASQESSSWSCWVKRAASNYPEYPAKMININVIRTPENDEKEKSEEQHEERNERHQRGGRGCEVGEQDQEMRTKLTSFMLSMHQSSSQLLITYFRSILIPLYLATFIQLPFLTIFRDSGSQSWRRKCWPTWTTPVVGASASSCNYTFVMLLHSVVLLLCTFGLHVRASSSPDSVGLIYPGAPAVVGTSTSTSLTRDRGWRGYRRVEPAGALDFDPINVEIEGGGIVEAMDIDDEHDDEDVVMDIEDEDEIMDIDQEDEGAVTDMIVEMGDVANQGIDDMRVCENCATLTFLAVALAMHPFPSSSSFSLLLGAGFDVPQCSAHIFKTIELASA